MAAHPKAAGASLRQIENAYANSRFIDEFGEDAFKRYDRETRDAMFKQKIVDNAFEDVFGDEENFDTLNNMTVEGKQALLDSKYQKIDTALDNLEEVRRKRKQIILGDKADDPVASSVYDLAQPFKFLDPKGMMEESRDKIITKELARDNERKQAKAEKLSKVYLNELKDAYNKGQLPFDIDDKFSEIAEGREEGDAFGGTIKIPGSRHWEAFKDSRLLRDFNDDDKLKAIAEYQAMSDIYGVYDAIDSLDKNIQKTIANNQSVWRHIGHSMANIGTGAAAYVMQGLLSFKTLAELGDKEGLANWLEGLDKNGEKLPDVLNISYWDGVDQFGTFSPEQINKARERGGISKMQLITEPGKEYGAVATIEAGVNMAKFVIPDLLINGVIAKGTSALAKKAGATLSKTGEVIGGTKAGKFIGNYVNPNLMAFRSGLGISQAYSMQTYDQAKQEGNAMVDKQVEADAREYVESVLATDEGKSVVGQYAANVVKQILAQNPNLRPEDINTEEIVAQGTAIYADKLRRDYIMNENLWKSDYNADRDEARKAAAVSAATDFIVEQIRMYGAGMSWKNYTYDKATRQKMVDNAAKRLKNEAQGYKFINTLTKEFALSNKTWGRVRPMASILWGGFESNYFDDVTVAFGKGFGLGQFNNYLARKYNPENEAKSVDVLSNFFTGLNAAVEGARKATVDKQSFYDGLVGALGSFNVMPRLSALKKDTYQSLRTDEAGNRLSIAESINKLAYNSLLQSYSDARVRERGYQQRIDAINNTIKNNRDAVNDLVQVMGAQESLFETIDLVDSPREIKDQKVKNAFLLASKLRQWEQDPIMSQSEFVKEAQSKLERLSKGNITDAEINEFISSPENKSIAEMPNGEQVARERIQKNASELVQMQQYYDEIMDDIKHSDSFGVIADSQNAQDVAEQLAFMRIADKDWKKRLSEMESEISGSTAVNNTRNRTARYGSRKGWERALEVAQDEVNAYQEEYDTLKDVYEKSSKLRTQKGIDRSAANIARDSIRRRLEGTKALLEDAKENIRTVKSEEVKPDEVLPLLSEAEILSLNPDERAYMLRLKDNRLINSNEYSKEQEKVIVQTANNLAMKDSSLMQKIQDSADISHMIEDNSRAYGEMVSNPMDVLRMVDNLKNNREDNARKRLVARYRDNNIDYLESITDDNELAKVARDVPSSIIREFMDRHPDKVQKLGDAWRISRLREDANSVIDKLFEDDTDKKNWKKHIIDITASPDVNTEEDAMRTLEEHIDLQDNDTNKQALDRILQGLQNKNYLRDATVIEGRRKAREEKERKTAEEAFRSDGKNFGLDGFKKGNVVTKNGTEQNYTIEGFSKDDNGNVFISLRSHKSGSTYKVKEENFKKRYEKKEAAKAGKGVDIASELNPPEKPAETSPEETSAPESPQEQMPEPEAAAENPSSQPPVEAPSVQDTFTEDGAVEQPTSDEQATIDSSLAGVDTVAPSDKDPFVQEDSPVVQDTGTFLGASMREFDLNALQNTPFKKLQRRTFDPERGNLMPQWFSWLDANGINLREIIDFELGEIVQRFPDTPIKFMKINATEGSELQDNMVVNVIELTPQLEKFHNPDRGIITINDKKYLVVGSLGYAKNSGTQGKNKFWNINNKLNQEAKEFFRNNADAKYYVSEGMYTEVSDMSNGWVVNALQNDTESSYRTLTELMQDPARNPRGYESLQDMIYGVLYDKGLVPSRNTSGLKFYPPKAASSRVGNTFVFVEVSNGVWIPLEIRTTDYTQLREGKLKDELEQLLTDITSPELEKRKDAARQLFGKERGRFLANDNGNILVGNEKHNNITVIRNGVRTDFDLNNFDRSKYWELISTTPFIVKTTMAIFQDAERLKTYDEAGALMTNSALLGTVAQTYNVWDIGADGKPVKKEITYQSQSVPKTRKFFATPLRGQIYRMTTVEGKAVYLDEKGKEIPQVEENRPLIQDIHYNILILNRNLNPIPDRSKTGNYYIVNNSAEKPLAIHRDSEGHITLMDDSQSRKVIQRENERIEREKRDAKAKAEVERLERAYDTTKKIQKGPGEEAKIFDVEYPDLAEKKSDIPQQSSQPIVKAPVSTREEKNNGGAMTELGKKSLTELQNEAAGTGENVTFARVWRNNYKTLIPLLENLTGKKPTSADEAQAMIESLRSSTTVKNDTLEEILKNCREFKK